ncbi:RNA polymerase sigma factor [Pedobacter sp. PWIIR3]
MRDFSDLDDSTILLQLSGGDQSAFDALYDRHWQLVFNTAFKRLGEVEKAKDITQDVFIQLLTRKETSPIQNLRAYLLVATRNAVFKAMEKGSRITFTDESATEVPDQSGSADAAIKHREFLQNFNELVNNLPEQQRIIFKMRFEEELTSVEIADRLQISPKTVRNQLGKALNTLRSTLYLLPFFIIFSS